MPRALPLEGIRVANFGWVWAGPVVGQTLGFLGAEVLKIESRARIDLTRMLPPFGGGVRDPDRSLSNHACWAGNGSVSLNLKKPEARELARQLIAKCDVGLVACSGISHRRELLYQFFRRGRRRPPLGDVRPLQPFVQHRKICGRQLAECDHLQAR